MSYKGQTQREREAWKKFLEEDAREQAAIVARIEAPIKLKQLETELNVNTRKLWRERRKQVMGYHENAYVPADIMNLLFNSEQEVKEFNSKEADAFFQEYSSKGWHPSKENVETLLGYFLNRPEVPRCFDIPVIDRRMYKAAFLSLKGAGVFEEPEPAPVPVAKPAAGPVEESFDHLERLPLGHQQPIAYKREPDGSQEGRDLVTGERRRYSSYEIELLSAEDYRRAFNVPTPTLSKGSFLKR
jgi:hypothetical protein